MCEIGAGHLNANHSLPGVHAPEDEVASHLILSQKVAGSNPVRSTKVH